MTALAGRGAEREEHLLARVPDELPQADPGERLQGQPQQDEEDQRDGVADGDELAVRGQRAETVLTDQMGRGAEDGERGQLHDEADDGEHDLLRLFDGGQDGGHLGVPEVQQRRSDEAGEDQHLEQGVLGERADRAVGQRVEDELARGRQFSAAGLLVHGGRVQRGGVDVHPLPRTRQIAGEQPDDERHRGRDLEPDERFEPHASERLEISRLGDPGDDHAEHQRRDHRLDQPDEPVAERLGGRAHIGPQPPDEDPGQQSDADLGEQ